MDGWDAEAAGFDEDADHGLRDPDVRAAWCSLLVEVLGPAPLAVTDLGCGTGSLSVLLAEEGHVVTGLDFSPAMLALAEDKARSAGVDVTHVLGDAADPPLPARSADVVLCRHVLWALPEPGAVLEQWRTLLRPGGRLVLVEGSWSTGAGLRAEECRALVAALGGDVEVSLLDDPALWGRPITDERYLVLARPDLERE